MSYSKGVVLQLSAGVIIILELEEEMHRSEVEIVENEGRRVLYRSYKASTAAVAECERADTASSTCPFLRGSFWRVIDSVDVDMDMDEKWQRGSFSCTQATGTPCQQQQQRRRRRSRTRAWGEPTRSPSPLKWCEGVRGGGVRSPLSGEPTSHVGKALGAVSSMINNGPCSSPNTVHACSTVSISLRGDNHRSGGSGRARWKNSFKLHSEVTSSHNRSWSRSDSFQLNAKAPSRPRPSYHCRAGESRHSGVGENLPLKENLDVIHRPVVLVMNRFRRLHMLQGLHRVELEREAFEDWQVLRDEFVRTGYNLMKPALSHFRALGRTDRRSGCEGVAPSRAEAAEAIISWKREKRRQERRFGSVALYGPRRENTTPPTAIRW